MWVRLHYQPKICRNVENCNFTAKQKYYWKRSFERYANTVDGKYLIAAIKHMKPEIGRVDSIRFIE